MDIVLPEVREDQREVGRWIGERKNAGDFKSLRGFVRGAGVMEPMPDDQLSSRARRLVETATTREKVDPLVSLMKIAPPDPVDSGPLPTTTGTGGDPAQSGKGKPGLPVASKPR